MNNAMGSIENGFQSFHERDFQLPCFVEPLHEIQRAGGCCAHALNGCAAAGHDKAAACVQELGAEAGDELG